MTAVSLLGTLAYLLMLVDGASHETLHVLAERIFYLCIIAWICTVSIRLQTKTEEWPVLTPA